MSELDRDYDEYRREHQSRFESEFGSWRERRQQKRGLLGQIREHMEVVGSDEEHVGTVDKVAGDRIILTKSDPESGGVAPFAELLGHRPRRRRPRDPRLLGRRGAQAAGATRAAAARLFEREDQGEMGPRMLDRSFEGTYR